MNILEMLQIHCRRLCGFLQLQTLALAFWAAHTNMAYGAEGAAAEEGKSYGLPWLAIVLIVALGVFITLRPASRAGEIKRDLKGDL